MYTYIHAYRGEEHKLAPLKKGITRMEMTIAANVMRPAPSDPSKTELTLLTHVNPGGLANTQFGAMVTNRLSAESPRLFIKKFNEVASGVITPTEVHERPKRRRPIAGLIARFRNFGAGDKHENKNGGDVERKGGIGARGGQIAAAVLAATLSVIGTRRRDAHMRAPRDDECDHGDDERGIELKPELVVSGQPA